MNVYLMPDMGLNLFSIGTAKTKGISVKIKDGLLCLKDKVGGTLDHTVHKDKLYYLQILTTRKPVNKDKAMPAIKDSKISRATWHRHLDHIEDSSLDNMSKNPKIVGLNLQGLTKTPLHLCDACTRANQKKKISRKPQNQATKVAELIHIDVVSPVTPKAYDGSL